MLDIKLERVKDEEIWEYASTNSFVLITKDNDFSWRATATSARTSVVWVRLGNCRKKALLATFESCSHKLSRPCRMKHRWSRSAKSQKCRTKKLESQ